PQVQVASQPRQGGRWRYEDLSQAFQDRLLAVEEQDEQLSGAETRVLEQVRARLEAGLDPESLPVLPATLNQLLRELNQEAAFARIREVIRQDPALAGEVVQLANSAWFKRNQQAVTSIEQAMALMGEEGLRTLTMTLLSQPVLRLLPLHYKLLGRVLWDHSLACAQACQRQAAVEWQTEATAYFVGLVSNVGKILIFRLASEALTGDGSGIRPRPAVFRQLIDAHGYPLAARTARAWGVPPEMILALEEQGDPHRNPADLSPLGRVLRRGQALAAAELLLAEGDHTLEEVEAQLAGQGLSLDDLRPAPTRH
ncbi:MAG: HDOD domain-containing protein, partial [Candidatus Competibacteraceae bacterium]|nr:HDOD domain-containing protein [Candidatus Competibacteraceae bacterium]